MRLCMLCLRNWLVLLSSVGRARALTRDVVLLSVRVRDFGGGAFFICYHADNEIRAAQLPLFITWNTLKHTHTHTPGVHQRALNRLAIDELLK